MGDFRARLISNMTFQKVEDFPKEVLNQLKEKSDSSEIEIIAFIYNDLSIEYVDNIHPDPHNYFLTSPEKNPDKDFILFHSHVKKGGFSDWDIENQEFHQKNMLLYDKIDEKFYYRECK